MNSDPTFEPFKPGYIQAQLADEQDAIDTRRAREMQQAAPDAAEQGEAPRAQP